MSFCTQYLKSQSPILSQNKCAAANQLNYIDREVKIIMLLSSAYLPSMDPQINR